LAENKLERTEIRPKAIKRAKERARVARWDLDVAVFLFVVLILIMILLFRNVGLEIVAPVAIFGLATVWIMGWNRGRQLYKIFYDEEMARLTRELVEKERAEQKTLEETIEEKVQKALRERWR
jgi:hypothetical protein